LSAVNDAVEHLLVFVASDVLIIVLVYMVLCFFCLISIYFFLAHFYTIMYLWRINVRINPFMPSVPKNGTLTLTVNREIIQALMGYTIYNCQYIFYIQCVAHYN